MEDRQIQKNAIDEAKNVALKLMDKGSYQVECSDEGLMHEEIESCLRPVIAAAKSSGGREWALKMLRRDRMGFLCQQEYSELAGLAQWRRRRVLLASNEGTACRFIGRQRLPLEALTRDWSARRQANRHRWRQWLPGHFPREPPRRARFLRCNTLA